jgi:glycine dehydrogenase subunit 1
LWAIAAAVYLSLLGPQGMQNLAETNMQKTSYTIDRLSGIKGVKAPLFSVAHFNEFTVNFDGCGMEVKTVNQALLERGILGGKDLSAEFPAMGQTALYCITEIHGKDDIDRLADALVHIVRS